MTLIWRTTIKFPLPWRVGILLIRFAYEIINKIWLTMVYYCMVPDLCIEAQPYGNWINCFQLGPALKGPRVGIIYSWLFKYTQQYTAWFTENNWAPHLIRPSCVYEYSPSKYIIVRSKYQNINAFKALYDVIISPLLNQLNIYRNYVSDHKCL